MLDVDHLPTRLEAFLKRRLPQAKSVVVTECTAMTGGYSCLMTRVVAVIDGERKVLVARSDVPSGQGVLETDRMQEWRVLSALTAQNTVPMPRALFADEDGTELGARTIILEFAEGGSFLNRLRADEQDRKAQAEALCDLAVAIHGADVDALREVLDHPGDWNAYLDRLIASWRAMEAELSDSVPMLRYMAAWLDANRPLPTALTLVHGEFQPSNQVLDADGRLMAVDFEFVHIGDPREDIGWCKWVESVQPPALIGIDDQAFCQRYCARSGLGSDVINPLSVAYFSILPSMKVFSGVLRSQQAFAQGSNTSMRVGYLLGATITAYEGWFNATRQIEAASRAAQGVC